MKRKLFSDEADDILIEMVYKNEILYDRELKDFRNVEKKNSIWQLIADKVGKDAMMCKSRWRDLRDNYFKILRKKSSDPTSSSSQKWPLFEKLAFLNSMRRERIQFDSNPSESLSNLSEGENSNNAYQTVLVCEVPVTPQNEIIPPPPPPPPLPPKSLIKPKAPKRKYTEEKPKRIKERSELIDYLIKNNKEDDDVDLFMKSIAATIKKLPPHKIRQAKKEILETVSRIEDESLDRQSAETSSYVESSYNSPIATSIYTKIEIEEQPTDI